MRRRSAGRGDRGAAAPAALEAEAPPYQPVDDRWSASSRRMARSAAFRAGGELAAKLASMAFFVVMARELGREGFGSFMFALSLTTVLMYASGIGTDELVAREVARDRARASRHLGDVIALKLVVGLPLLLLAVAVVGLGDFPAGAELAVLIVGAGAAVENLARTYHGVFTGFERLEMISVALVLQRSATAAVGIAVLLNGGGLILVSLVYATGSLVGLWAARHVLRRYVVADNLTVDRSRWAALVRAALPIGLAGVLLTALLRVDATVLAVIAGAEAVGVYGAAFRLVEATLFISWAFAASALPWMARSEHAATTARGFELGVKVITALLLPLALSFIFLAEQIVHLLYGAGYDEAVTPLRLLAAVTVLFGIGNFAGIVLLSRDRARGFTIVVAVVLVENLILNVLLIPRYGADAAAFNASLSGLLLAGLGVGVVALQIGRVHVLRAFGAAAAAGSVMTVVALALPAPAGVAAALAAYAGALLAFERLVHPAEFERLTSALPRSSRRGSSR